MSQEIAVPTPREVAAPVNLDLYADLVKQEEFLRNTINEWKRQHEEVKAKIQSLMGDAEEAVFAGATAFTWARIDRMNTSDFVKAYPVLAEVYTRIVPKPELDVEALRRDRPEQFREFQVRQFKKVS